MADSPFIRNNYYLPEFLVYGTFYNVLILSKYPFLPIQFSYDKDSQMGRCLMLGLLSINGRHLAIGTTHLESLGVGLPFRKA